MNLAEYYSDKKKEIAGLEKLANSEASPAVTADGVVYVTSLFHRERNSTAGCTLTASISNAARVITDGTHRVATEAEIKAFLNHQQKEFVKNSASEQKNKRQYIVVVDQKENADQVLTGTSPAQPAEAKKPIAASAK
jgi:hypothetical protein